MTALACSEKHNVTLTNVEWFEISRALEPFHAVFYKVWDMGKPFFNEEIETAAVQFDENGQFVIFHFNPLFWKRLQFKDKIWVICHEALHIILNHGVRTCDINKTNHKAVNAALDIVVNHSLCNNFGFERSNIEDWQNYCWVDTVFPHKKPTPPDDQSFEYYYNLFDKVYGDGDMGDGSEDGPSTVDDHSFMSEKPHACNKIIEKLNDSLSTEEKESIKTVINKHFEKPNQKHAVAGQGSGTWVFSKAKLAPVKRKWETVIKNWSKKHLIPKDKDIEQWARINRRLVLLPTDMFLPSEMETDEADHEKTQIDVWFFLDTSGSCWSLKDRFFEAASTLSKERFHVRLFCFDTTVQETTLASRRIYGGGGTSFSILEKAIIQELNSSNEYKQLNDKSKVKKISKYPEAIFVITDGYGDVIRPSKPENWHWFITYDGTNNYIDKKCNLYNLGDFE